MQNVDTRYNYFFSQKKIRKKCVDVVKWLLKRGEKPEHYYEP